MKVNVFCKKGQSRDGRYFPIYLSTLTKKNGEETRVSLKFRETCGAPDPKECPCVIEIDKANANLVTKPIILDDGTYLTDESGEIKYSKTMWVSDWTLIGPYIDTSLDDYE